jgi:hypothetical protein
MAATVFHIVPDDSFDDWIVQTPLEKVLAFLDELAHSTAELRSQGSFGN